MVTYRQLWRASPAAWVATAVAARDHARQVGIRTVEASGQVRVLGAGWGGEAAAAATRRLSALRDRLELHTVPLIAVDQILTEHAGRIGRAKAMLEATLSAVAHTRVTVDIDGRVGLDYSGDKPDPGDVAAARRTAAGIRAALDLAARADAETAGRLAGLAAWSRPAPPEPPAWVPSRTTDPATVRAWWAGLSEAQRQWLILRRPGLVGSLDGVPAAARDQANRLLLAGLSDAGLSDAGLDELRAWLRRAGPPRPYLLRLEEGTGRAVVALGDPDLARHVLVHVPGAGSSLDNVGTDLVRADRVLARAAELAAGESTAAVVWLDYDVPDSVGEAARAGYAHHAGPGLRQFVDGLRATHAGPAPPHLTVLGHSYGSLVVGATARDHGLAADDVVFVGSAGVGVAHVDQLRLPAEHVWSTTARQDPIQHVAPSLAQAGRDVALSLALPAYAGVAVLQPDEDLWHGHNPSRPDFGGRVFASAPETPVCTAHTAYWEAGNVALDNIARITVGGVHQAAVR